MRWAATTLYKIYVRSNCQTMVFFVLLAISPGLSAHGLAPAHNVTAQDEPDDGGGVIQVRWEISESGGVARYEIIRMKGAGATDGIVVGVRNGAQDSFLDEGDEHAIENDVDYRYTVRAVGADGETADSEPSAQVRASASWLDTTLAANMVAVIVFAAMFFVLVMRGRRGKPLYIRPIDALEAMDDAVGRAAEMGRPVFYAPGLHSVTQPATVASIGLLSRVAEKSARLHTRIMVPNYDPLTWPVAQEVVRQSFIKAGRQEEYDPDDISYLTSRSFTYAAAVAGMIVREKPATNFLFGHFYSEFLILAETGAATGALQIGGTDSTAQLPFFITTCDKTMIGEELFAAAAIVGDDPISRSTVKAHDWFKVALMVLIPTGIAVGMLADFGMLEELLHGLGVGDPAAAASGIVEALRGGR